MFCLLVAGTCDYDRMMSHTRFALVPRGNGLHTHRMFESMAAGAVPVIVAVCPFVRLSAVCLFAGLFFLCV